MKFDTLNHQINGDLKLFYKNGKLKCSRQFSKNQKIGEWKFYALNRKLIFSRNYTNNFIFSDFSNTPKFPIKDLYQFKYGNTNHYDVSYSTNIITLVKNDKPNSLLFENNLLQNEIIDYIQNSKETEIYENINFKEKVSSDSLKSIVNNKKTFNAYLLKEIVYYNLKHQVLIRRVLSISPVEISKENKPLWTASP